MQKPFPTVAPYERRASIGQSFDYLGNLATILAESADTNGQFGLVELLAKPGQEPPLHLHEREDELFYVVQGEVDYILDGHAISAITGSSVFLPRGIPHTFRVRSAQAWLLVFVTPGGFEGYFREVATPTSTLEIPPQALLEGQIDRCIETAAKYGVRFLTPEQRVEIAA